VPRSARSCFDFHHTARTRLARGSRFASGACCVRRVKSQPTSLDSWGSAMASCSWRGRFRPGTANPSYVPLVCAPAYSVHLIRSMSWVWTYFYYRAQTGCFCATREIWFRAVCCLLGEDLERIEVPSSHLRSIRYRCSFWGGFFASHASERESGWAYSLYGQWSSVLVPLFQTPITSAS